MFPRHLPSILIALAAAGCGGSGLDTSTAVIPDVIADPADAASEAMDSTPADDAEVNLEVLEDVAQEAPAPTPPADLFALGPPVAIELTVDAASLESLESDPFTWVTGTVSIAGWTVEQPVSVRLGGEFGGQRDLSEKAYVVIRFQDPFAGLTELNLNNNVRNRAQLRAQVSYAMARDWGVPAPRASWAWLRINGDVYGLYGLEESITDPGFLSRWFPGTEGDVYRVGADNADLVPADIPGVVRLTGDSDDSADLQALAAALVDIDQNYASQDVYAALASVFDVDAYVDFAALEIFVAHTEGYAMRPANYAIHRGSDGRWSFVAASMERAFRGINTPWSAGGIVQRLCLRSLACRKQLGARLQAIVERADVNGILGVALSARALVLSLIAEDPRVEAKPQQVEGAANQTINRLLGWAEALPFNLACADPPSVDRDGDGFSGCTDDCDDDDPEVNPGMPEICNLKDDDCSGAIDDNDSCDKCVPFIGPGDVAYEMCFEPRSWQDSRDYCVSLGGDLASIHSELVQIALKDAAFDVLFEHWWIGLNDIDVEGEFVWSDGSSLDYSSWNDGEPNDSNGEDCAHISTWGDGGWNDIPCDHAYPQVCQLPAFLGP